MWNSFSFNGSVIEKSNCSCLENNNHTKSDACPVCSTKSTPDETEEDTIVSNLEWNHEIVKCKHIGCNFTARRNEMYKHEDNPNTAHTYLNLIKSESVSRLNQVEEKLTKNENLLKYMQLQDMRASPQQKSASEKNLPTTKTTTSLSAAIISGSVPRNVQETDRQHVRYCQQHRDTNFQMFRQRMKLSF